MAITNVLKQTLYWSANPVEILNDMGGTGAVIARSITAAESHDGSSATYAGPSAPDDGISINGDATLSLGQSLDVASASGAIAFLRIKMTAFRTSTTDTNVEVAPAISGSAVAAAHAGTSTATSYSDDVATDPADGQPWTNAKINGKTFGADLRGWSTSATFIRTAVAKLSEFSVEIWGPGEPDVVTATASAVDATASAGAAGSSADAAESTSEGVDVEPVLAPRDPSASTVLYALVDGGSTPIVLRSNTSPLGDQDATTYASDSTPGSWPVSDTLIVNAGGFGSTGISGEGTISGVRFFALARLRKDAHATPSNYRFLLSGVSLPLLSDPPSGSYAAVPAMGVVSTALVTTTDGSTEWTWANLFAALVGLTLRVDVAIGAPYVGEFAQLDCGEIWAEVWGPVGSAPEFIELRQVFDSHKKTVAIRSTV